MLGLLLTNRWLQLVAAIIITFALSYSWGRYTGYANEHQARLTERAEWKAVVDAANTKTEALREGISNALEEATLQLKHQQVMLKEKDKQLQRRIKENEELKRITIPRSAVELFNDSTGSKQPAVVNEEAKPRVNEEAGRPATTTLGELISVSATNNSNHLACVVQVEALQHFVCELYGADGQTLDFEVCSEGGP